MPDLGLYPSVVRLSPIIECLDRFSIVVWIGFLSIVCFSLAGEHKAMQMRPTYSSPEYSQHPSRLVILPKLPVSGCRPQQR